MIYDRIENATHLIHFDIWSCSLCIYFFHNSIQQLSFEIFTCCLEYSLIYYSLISVITRRFKILLRLSRNANFKDKHQLYFLSISIYKITSLMRILSRSEMNKKLIDFYFSQFWFFTSLSLRNDSQLLNISFVSIS